MLESKQVLGRYQLHKKLGHHAGRQTWSALNTTTSPPEPVVVKLLAFSPVMQWEELKLFEREAQVLKDLNHPYIPQYRDYFSIDKETGNKLCWFALVQDYIPGHSLQQLLEEGKRFNENQVRKIATDILSILTYLHSIDPPVLHRDIKPSNLILGEDEQIYLVDFGAVQNQAANEGVTFTIVGTTGYAPLEQFGGRAVPASDLYALGATLIHLLTGISPANLPQRNLRVQFREQVSVDSQLISWIEALTEPGIERRFSTAKEAIEWLESGQIRNLFVPSPLTQPTNSRLKLKKSPDSLFIKISNHRLNVFDLILSCVISSFSLGFLIILISLISNFFLLVIWIINLINPYFTVYIGIFIIFLLVLLLWKAITKGLDRLQNILKVLDSYFVESQLWFEKDKFVVEKRRFKKYSRQEGSISEILKLESTFKGIEIETDLKHYIFSQDLSKHERDWLVQEIQDWLDYR